MIKLLAVDDSPEVRELLRMTFDFDDYEFREAGNGEEALTLIREWKPDIVLLDIMMPGQFDGIDVCRLIKQDPDLQHIFVAMLTAKSEKEDMDICRELGANAYLIKPFYPLELVSLVSRFMGSKPHPRKEQN